MAEEPTTPVRVKLSTLERMERFRALLGYSQKRFVEDCVAAICELAESPNDKRRLPGIIVQIDALIENEKKPIRFPAAEVLKKAGDAAKKQS